MPPLSFLFTDLIWWLYHCIATKYMKLTSTKGWVDSNFFRFYFATGIEHFLIFWRNVFKTTCLYTLTKHIEKRILWAILNNSWKQLEYELSYYDSAVHCFNHYTTRTPPWFSWDNVLLVICCIKMLKIFIK